MERMETQDLNQREKGHSLSIEGQNAGGKIRIGDFMVDFFGSLIPGIAFIFAVAPAIIFPPYIVTRILEGAEVGTPILNESLESLISSFRFELIISLLVISYILGHLFFRQDPKIPDQLSYERVKPEIGDDGPFHGKMEDCEFPYIHLGQYLEKRGMSHLAGMIPWYNSKTSKQGKKGNPEDQNKIHEKRSKHFVNVLKVRLEFMFPERYSRIARNEGHVRLMSSAWYMSRTLIYLSIIGLVMGILSIGIAAYEIQAVWPIAHLRAVILPAVVWISAIRIKSGIERVLHYQRIREVVFLLETAYFANKLKPGILEPIYPANTKKGA